MRARVIALLALAIPVLAGLIYIWTFAAPVAYLAVNAGALAIGALVILLLPTAPTPTVMRALTIFALSALFVPLLTGPEINGITRWLPLGPFNLHAGSLLVPALMVSAARDEDYAPLILATALFAASLQPDMATGAALMLAGVGFYLASHDWKYALFVIIAFFASLVMAINGELAPQPFVERVLISLIRENPLVALALLIAQLASFFLMLHAVPGEPTARRALAGSFFGYFVVSILSNYPSIMIGYGAAPIIGFALALALLAARPERSEIDV